MTTDSEMVENRKRETPTNAGCDPTWPVQYTFSDIIGKSAKIMQVKGLALQAAKGGSSVLLVGESGTGKEMFAHAIHGASPRSASPFVPVDCSAIPQELLEAELFGYAAGAFTSAAKEGKPGKFELAQGGTIFLDEVGEIALGMQTKFLRVLQERRVVRVGGVTSIPVSFALIGATNRDLESMVAQGLFRRDLLYRLDVIRIGISPLCERPEDIPLLVEYHWEQRSRELGKTVKLSSEALRVMEEYSWPGNVRELLNIVERLLVSASKSVIEPQDLPAYLTRKTTGNSLHFPTFHLQTILQEAERRTLERALRQARGNRNKAAQLVGLSRASLYRKLKFHDLVDIDREEEPLHRLP